MKFRNLGIIAHVDAGKTTLTERILKVTNKIFSVGEVHEGKATMDFMELEAQKGITIQSACTTCNWKNANINIIDTPGHIDFTIEVERALRVLDGAIIVLEGVAGVEAQSEKVYRQSEKHGIAKIIFVNKLDRLGANYDNVLEQVRNKLSPNAISLHIPYYEGERFAGYVELLTYTIKYWPTDDLNDGQVLQWSDKFNNEEIEDLFVERAKLVDQCLVLDEDIERYLEGEEMTLDVIFRNIRHGTITGALIPVLCGSAFKNKGVADLLDAVKLFLPSPEEVERNKPLISEANVLFVFKITHDPQIGALYYCRVYSGQISKNVKLVNVRNNEPIRINRIIQMNANQHINLDSAGVGEIVVLTSLSNVRTGDTLATNISVPPLYPIDIPRPVIELTITPKTGADRTNLSMALERLMIEDPSFSVVYNPITKETLIKGMGELHLEVIIERIKREYKTNLIVGSPKVSFKETISKEINGYNELKKQTGGKGSYAEIYFTLTPLEAPEEDGEESSLLFESKIEGGVIPKNFWPAIERGFREEAQKGYYAGYPLTNLKFTLTDGSFHSVDSSDLSFEMCTRAGLRKALSTTKGILLEPIMKVEIYTPEEYVGDIMNNASSKRGIITQTINSTWYTLVNARMPLLSILGHNSSPYIENLRKITRGRASFAMMFSKYDITPDHIAETYFIKQKPEDAE